jgi:taurine dioxygenase
MAVTERPQQIEVQQVAGNIGAEILGVDTGGELTDDVVAQIRQELLAHKVVFLRDQALDYERQIAFARRFGTLTLGHPLLPSPPGQQHMEEMDSAKGARADFWHTDVTFLERPVAFTFLHGIVMPKVGGDTLWANTAVAYERLSPQLRALADSLRVIHTNVHDVAGAPSREATDSVKAEHDRLFRTKLFRTEHPAVRVHPETGERSLLLGGFAQKIVGFGAQASRDLLRTLQDHITRPDNTMRWRWRAGDLAIWDNRATQHFAIYDYGTQYRRAERVTIAGPVPVGVDGRPTVALDGEAEEFYAGQPSG